MAVSKPTTCADDAQCIFYEAFAALTDWPGGVSAKRVLWTGERRKTAPNTCCGPIPGRQTKLLVFGRTGVGSVVTDRTIACRHTTLCVADPSFAVRHPCPQVERSISLLSTQRDGESTYQHRPPLPLPLPPQRYGKTPLNIGRSLSCSQSTNNILRRLKLSSAVRFATSSVARRDAYTSHDVLKMDCRGWRPR